MADLFLHVRFRVADIDRSVDYYVKHLGFEAKSVSPKGSTSSPAGNRLAFLELPGNSFALELCESDYKPEVPEDLIHTCIGVPDLISYCDRLEKEGLEIWPDGWREQFVDGQKMAFVTDPDGYEVELVERK